VLVVDDNRDAAATLAELLDLIGYTVMVANSGEEALERAPLFAPEVIFLDIGMPGMDGYQTATALRREPGCHGTLLVALTGWGGADDRARTSQAGFDLHLTKPVNLDAVSQLLATRAAELKMGQGQA
jgi:CheY-like chemotaxis protein